ncbi:hypothetical protein BXZ70DRAFT_688522 [Cristinia sonorae]|uniref:Hydrophobin n=1 Tax=Cristinia sonorae TaxID=1940300 RepID=A0A8K0XK66_9AGAR|nr:hypothetical protein BXZ70DRAFT_688522 [Cristinia sonorae]
MTLKFARNITSFVGVTSVLAILAVATPQGYNAYRPYDPTGTSNSGTDVGTAGSGSGSAEGSSGIFGNDDSGLDNGVDDNNGTPFGVDTNRGGSGGGGDEPTPDPAPICSGTIKCCSEPFSGAYDTVSLEAQTALLFYGLPADSPGLVSVACNTDTIEGAATCPSQPYCCTGPSSGVVFTGCVALVID